MLPNKPMTSSSADQMSADWIMLKDVLNHKDGETNDRYWKKAVCAYVTSTPLLNDTEEAYKDFFRQFWKNSIPMISNHTKAIHIAAREGYDVFIRNWLTRLSHADSIAILNKRSPTGDTPLHTAVDRGHLATVKDMLVKGANINATGDLNETPLHRAVYHNFTDIIKLLLNHHASCEMKRMDGEKPIHIAAMTGSLAAIDALVAHDRTQLKSAGREGRSAFHRAAQCGNIEVMEKLLALGDDVNQINSYTKDSVLHQAAILNNTDMIAFLLKNRANIDIQDGRGFTPLQHCAMKFNPSFDAAKLLIESGADVNYGQPTPLYLLASKANQRSEQTVNFARLLVEHGARVDASHNDETAINLLENLKRSQRIHADELALYDYLKTITNS